MEGFPCAFASIQGEFSGRTWADVADSDGAAFAFVDTTDPEVLLLVRANLRVQEPIWEFAAARMTMVHAFLTVEERVVWSVAWWDKINDTTYLTRGGVPFSERARAGCESRCSCAIGRGVPAPARAARGRR